MSLTINGAQPKTVNVIQNNSTTEVNVVKVKKNGNYTCVWAKPFTLYLLNGDYCKISVRRISSLVGSASIGTLSNGSRIYFGDRLLITAITPNDYTAELVINGIFQKSSIATKDINGNLTVSVVETYLRAALESPKISGTFKYDTHGGFYYLNFNIKNENTVSVTATIEVYSGNSILERKYEKTVAANSETSNGYELYETGALVCVKFEKNGYKTSTGSMKFGNYTGSNPVEETTTTTTS